MQRLAEKQVTAWKDSTRRKPMIIRGARQVGKTWVVENILAGQFENFVKIDLEKRRDLHIHFAGNLEPQTILNHLELATGRIMPGRTLLFLMKSRPARGQSWHCAIFMNRCRNFMLLPPVHCWSLRLARFPFPLVACNICTCIR